MYISEIITAVKDVLVGFAAIATVIIGSKGLQTWQRELKGKKEFETAMGLIKATYKLRDELRVSRSAMVWAYEFPEDYQQKQEHTSQEQAQAYAHVFKNRWEPVWNAKQLFDATALEAEALWGAEIKENIDAFNQCVRNLNTAMQAIVDDKTNAGEDFKTNHEFGKDMRSTAFATDEKNNRLTQEIMAAVNGIEKVVLPHLRRS